MEEFHANDANYKDRNDVLLLNADVSYGIENQYIYIYKYI